MIHQYVVDSEKNILRPYNEDARRYVKKRDDYRRFVNDLKPRCFIEYSDFERAVAEAVKEPDVDSALLKLIEVLQNEQRT